MRIRPLHFAAFLLVLNLVQVAFTELTRDEGYYWFYSRSLEWGYAEHPPLIALMVRIGYALFPNQLGVRLVNVILNALGVLLLFTLVPRREPKKDTRIFPEGTVIPPGGQGEFTTSLRLPALVEGVHTVEFGIRYAPLSDAYSSQLLNSE